MTVSTNRKLSFKSWTCSTFIQLFSIVFFNPYCVYGAERNVTQQTELDSTISWKHFFKCTIFSCGYGFAQRGVFFWISNSTRPRSSSKFSGDILKNFLYSSLSSSLNSRNRVLSTPRSFLRPNHGFTHINLCLFFFVLFLFLLIAATLITAAAHSLSANDEMRDSNKKHFNLLDSVNGRSHPINLNNQ